MNFNLNKDNKYENQGHKKNGSCCTAECKYVSDGKEVDKNGQVIHSWFACSESCIKSNCKITCRVCAHKPDYMIFD